MPSLFHCCAAYVVRYLPIASADLSSLSHLLRASPRVATTTFGISKLHFADVVDVMSQPLSTAIGQLQLALPYKDDHYLSCISNIVDSDRM